MNVWVAIAGYLAAGLLLAREVMEFSAKHGRQGRWWRQRGDDSAATMDARRADLLNFWAKAVAYLLAATLLGVAMA